MANASKYAAAHVHPAGPGDARPTAMAIVEDEGLVGGLKGKVVLITGCSSGIGVETARALHATGADLFITVRDVAKGQEVVKDILATNSNSQGSIELLKLELDSLQSVRECAAEFLSKSKQLHILINNAGVMACPEGTTKDGFETQFGTNHLGHFLLFQLLKPTLLASSAPGFNSRVVCLSSSAHRRSPIHFDDLNLKKQGYDLWVSYGQSKTANIYMATEIDRRYGSQGLHANAVHPGGIMTPLQRHLDPAVVNSWDTPEIRAMLKSPEQGAATTVWAAIAKEWEGEGGKFLEDCGVAAPHEGEGILKPGYAPHAYDQAAAQRLWEESCQLVGLSADA